jgi:NAD(P)-dependent dehydrogenase (short-subunit alcohol dehydrogenase family)
MTETDRRVAIVTGANRGLGRAIALSIAERGLHVVVAARSSTDAEEVVSDAGPNLSLSAHQCDIGDPASVARLMADVGFEYGRLDALVNNAGIAIDRGQQASSADMERAHATMNVNLLGTWRCCTAAIPEMRRNGYGRIVNVTSHMGTFNEAGTGSAAYRISKTAVNMLTRVLAEELRDDNILVNAASPGKVATRLAYGKADQKPDEAADTFAWLATLPDGGPTGKLFHQRSELPW